MNNLKTIDRFARQREKTEVGGSCRVIAEIKTGEGGMGLFVSMTAGHKGLRHQPNAPFVEKKRFKSEGEVEPAFYSRKCLNRRSRCSRKGESGHKPARLIPGNIQEREKWPRLHAIRYHDRTKIRRSKRGMIAEREMTVKRVKRKVESKRARKKSAQTVFGGRHLRREVYLKEVKVTTSYDGPCWEEKADSF